MNKKIGILVYISSLATAISILCCAVSQNPIYTIGSDGVVWQHYAGQDSTNENIGYREYWTNCTNHEFEFTNPGGEVEEGKTQSSEILSDIGSNYSDPRFIAKKGTANIDTTASTNWTANSKEELIRIEYNQTINDHPNLIKFRNYQWADWKETQLGLTGTYTNPSEPVNVNKISFHYYLQHENSGNGKADLNVNISIIDYTGKEYGIDSFKVSKDEPSAWMPYQKTLSFLNFKKLVITTTSGLETLGSNVGIGTNLYIGNLSLSVDAPVPTGDVDISTTDSSLWSSVPKNPDENPVNNKIMVGTGPWWGSESGVYLTLRTYQWSEWSVGEAGLKATYTNNIVRTVNKLEFKYYINSTDNSFISKSLTVKFYICGGGNRLEVHSMLLNIETVTRDTVISVVVEFTDQIFEKLEIETETADPKGTAGNSCVYIKEMAAKYDA